MVGTGRFELPTPRTPSECSTRLSHVPTRKEPAAAHPQRMGSNQSILPPAAPFRLTMHPVDVEVCHCRLRFDFLEEGLGGWCRASSRIANWIFFSTGSIRSTSTRIFCPRL